MSGATTPANISAAANPSKRPFEESSPAENEAPDAKRPALDKSAQSTPPHVKPSSPAPPLIIEPAETANEDAVDEKMTNATDTNGEIVEIKKEEEPIKAEAEEVPAKQNLTNGNSTKPEPIKTELDVSHGPQTASSYMTAGSPALSQVQNESAWIHIRAVISSAEAATIIGKGGENVTSIRKLSGARCTVSEYLRGAIERILTVSGPVDAVAKVCRKSIHILKIQDH